jgi:hypothetical protein
MNIAARPVSKIVFVITCLFMIVPICLQGNDRLQIEIYGGFSYLNPKDFNLLSSAEEQYNNIYFLDNVRWRSGYFINDFPMIKSAFPAGFRVKYFINPSLCLSLAAEGFYQQKKESKEGTFTYEDSYMREVQSREYDPYRLGLKGYTLIGGIHYKVPIRKFLELEAGIAAGWTRADVDFSSTWSYLIEYQDPYVQYSSLDSGLLEEKGSGNGFTAQGLLRLTRMLGKSFGFYIEAAGTFCRLKSIEGTGREVRLGYPEESTWDGLWAIKKEEINMRWGDEEVLVPTNYWDNWIEAQRERDFILDLSGIRLVVGILFRL